MAGRATVKSTLDEKLADPYYDWAQENTNLGNDVVGNARQAMERLQSHNVVDQVDADLRNKAIVERGPDYTYGDVAYDTGSAALIPASFLTGPVGLAAGGALALDSLRKGIQTGNKGELLSAALGALPFMRLGKVAKVGQAASEARPLEVMTSSIDDLASKAKGAGKRGVAPHAGANEGRAAMFDDVLSRQPKSQPGPEVFDMTGAPGTRVATNTAPADLANPNAGGRLTGVGSRPQRIEDVIDDALLDTASDPSANEAIAALRQATQRVRPAAGVTGELPSLGRGVTQAANPMTLQTPELLDATAETVSAPGFGLGRVTPMSEVPTSRAAMEAMRQKVAPVADVAQEVVKPTVKRLPPRLATPQDQVAGFSDLTDEEILRAIEQGYEYGAGVPAYMR